jgi:hypothetical protein
MATFSGPGIIGAVAAAWDGPSARSGPPVAVEGGVGTAPIVSSLLGGTATAPTVVGIDAEYAYAAAWDGPSARSGPALAVEGGVGTAPIVSSLLGGTATAPTVTGVEADNAFAASFIPTAFFRRLSGSVVDQNGEPITSAERIFATENLPTGGTVNEDGTFQMYVLNQTYTEFLLVAPSGRDGVDYSWYRYDGDPIPPGENDVTLAFKEHEIKGLYVGAGTDFGGMLG